MSERHRVGRLVLAFGICLCASISLVHSDDETRRFVVLTIGPDPFFEATQMGTAAAEMDLKLSETGYEVDFQHGDFTAGAQADKLNQYATEGDVAAVAIAVYNPGDPQLVAAMRGLRESGVHVITIDADVDRDESRNARFAFIGGDNAAAARELGRAARALNPEANYAFFVGNLAAGNAVERMREFADAIGEDAMELDRLEDGGDRTRTRSNVESVLSRYENVDMLVGVWAYNTPLIANEVEANAIHDRIQVVGFDAARASLDAMAEGSVDALVAQNPYQIGYDCVRLMTALAEDDATTVEEMFPDYSQEEGNDLYLLPPRIIVPDEDSPITPELFGDSTQLLKLRDFRAWMSKHGLLAS